MNRKDFGFATLCGFVGAVWVYLLWQRIDPNIFSSGAADIYFDADIWRVYGNLFLHSHQNRANIHPFFAIFVVIPFLLLKAILGLEPVRMIPVVVISIGTIFSAAVYCGLRVWRFSTLESLIFTAFAMVTGSVVIFSPVIESFLFAAVSIVLCFFLFARQKSIWLGALAIVVSYGITITNVAVGIYAVYLAFPTWKSRIKVIGLGFAVIGALSLLEFVPGYPLKGNNNSLTVEKKFLNTPDFSQTTSVLRSVFVDSVVLPTPELGPMPLLRKFTSPINSAATFENASFSGHPISIIALLVWSLIFLCGVFVLFSKSEFEKEKRFLFFGLTFNVLLHILYGDEKFLYSLHWLPFLIFIAAFAVRTSKKQMTTTLAAFAIFPVGIHNYLQSAKVRELIEIPKVEEVTDIPFEVLLVDSSGTKLQTINLSPSQQGVWTFEIPPPPAGAKGPALLLKSKGSGSIFNLARSSLNIHVNYRWTVSLSSVSSVSIDGRETRSVHPPTRFLDGQGVSRIEFGSGPIRGSIMDSLSIKEFPLFSEPANAGSRKSIKSFRHAQKQADDFARLPYPDFTNTEGWKLFVRVRDKENYYKWQMPPPHIQDADLGISNLPSIEGREIARTKDNLMYDVVYTHDEFARRETPVDKKKTYNKFITLFGCSFTYGSCVDDQQTINYFLTNNNQRYFAYNYAVPSVGTNFVLAQLQSIDFQKQIPEKSGVFVYVFMTQHIQRAAGYLPSTNDQRKGPYFTKDVNGHMVRAGSIESARPFYSGALSILDKLFGENLLAGKEFPARSEADELYACDLVVEMNRVVKSKSPENSFVVYLHPYYPIPDKFLHCLKENKIATIPGKMPGKPENFVVQGDGHPNGKWNQFIATEILEFLK